MTVSWGFVHRNRKIGPLFGRSFGKCFAVISGLYRTPGRPRRTGIQGSRRPSQTADFSKLRQNAKNEENREIEQNRRLEAISQDPGGSWDLAGFLGPSWSRDPPSWSRDLPSWSRDLPGGSPRSPSWSPRSPSWSPSWSRSLRWLPRWSPSCSRSLRWLSYGCHYVVLCGPMGLPTLCYM